MQRWAPQLPAAMMPAPAGEAAWGWGCGAAPRASSLQRCSHCITGCSTAESSPAVFKRCCCLSLDEIPPGPGEWGVKQHKFVVWRWEPEPCLLVLTLTRSPSARASCPTAFGFFTPNSPLTVTGQLTPQRLAAVRAP